MAKELLTKDRLAARKTSDETVEDSQPKNLRANVMPTSGYGLEVDGKMKSQHVTADAAMQAGLALKTKFPLIQVKVFDAKAQERIPVELPKA